MARLSRRDRIRAAFDGLHDAAAAALAAAARLRAGAERAHAEALVETWLRTDGLDAVRADPGLRRLLDNPRLADVVGRVEADRAAAFAEWLGTGPAALTELMRTAAPGTAGDPHTEWLGTVGVAEGVQQRGPELDPDVPALWRIGEGRIGGGRIGEGRAGDPDTAGGFPVGVPLLDESHLQVHSAPESRARAEALVEQLLMRLVSHFRPGLVQVHVWDVDRLTGAVPDLYPLTRTGLLTVHDPGRLPQLLDELADRIRRVHTRVLVDGEPSLRALPGPRREPWVVAVLAGNRRPLRDEHHDQLQRLARSGPACGVHLVLLDVPMTVSAPVETVKLNADGTAASSMTGPFVEVLPDPPLPRERIVAACHAIADRHEELRAGSGRFADLLPREEWGTESSIGGLSAPVGFDEGDEVPVVLADLSPHALVGGPSGSGKTNLLLTLIASLSARYGPDELEFYLLDFKEGVSFAQFAPGRRGGTWLPHARLVGVNINTDREFGLALLRFLSDEMRTRAEAAKAKEVTKLEELRLADPGGRWPRIVAVIDEFQYLFNERDTVTRAAIGLLEDVARRGRSQGIHLVLASQDVAGIEAFWGRQAIFEQFVLRIALPRARQVLDKVNDAARALPRWHAVVNHESGLRHGNVVARIPDATGADTVEAVQERVHRMYPTCPDGSPRPQPRLFDGNRSPRFDALVAAAGPTAEGEPPRALVGQCIDVAGRAATVALPAAPGRNLAVLGPGASDATRVLSAAAASLARQYRPGEVDVVVASFVSEASAATKDLVQRLGEYGHGHTVWAREYYRERVVKLDSEITNRLAGGDRRPTLVLLYAADAGDVVLERSGTEALRRILRFGPETDVHVLGWWRSVQRLKALLTLGATADDVGAWVALDVQGAELSVLAPGPPPVWAPRPGRGLFFDRAQHAQPEVVIVPSLEAP